MRSSAVLAAALVAGLFALPACQTYAINRAAFVPHATPVPGDGQPLSAPAEVQLGASNLADLRAPGLGDPSSAVEVPGTQLRGGLGLRINEYLALGLHYEEGLHATAEQTNRTAPRVEGGDVSGGGGSIALTLPLDDQWSIGLTTELALWSTPWTAYSTEQDSGSTYKTGGTDTVATLAFGLVPSYRSGRWTFFGGGTLRNHPTIRQKDILNEVESGGHVTEGHDGLTLHAGAEVELGARIRASLYVAQTVTTDPVKYGPSVGLMFTIPIGELHPPDTIITGAVAIAKALAAPQPQALPRD
jgi:hypothetical protein